jgi:hypothetical protein
MAGTSIVMAHAHTHMRAQREQIFESNRCYSR